MSQSIHTHIVNDFILLWISDKIAVLNDGKFAEIGTYEDLMTIQNGMFKKLVEKQTITQ
jgi:ABC-type transport system involved in cytochrome bd biosynthesis fused ATPase/permease subunit